MISIICSYTNKDLMEKMLIKSLKEQTITDYEIITIDSKKMGFNSAAQTLNYGASISNGDLLLFVHQDIEFIDVDALQKIRKYSDSYEYGIAGVAGVSHFKNQKFHVYSSVFQGLDKKIAGIYNDAVNEVETLDECLLIIKKKKFKKFIDYGSWHFYGVEYSLRTIDNGEKVLLFPINIYHLSPGWSLNNSYWETLKKVAKKNKNRKYIPTTMGIFINNIFLNFQICIKKVKRKIKSILIRKK